MINSIKVTGGYASKLPSIKDKTFVFTPGINVLFAPNGSGKSSILKIIAGHTVSLEGQWSSLRIDRNYPALRLTNRKDIVFPDCIDAYGCPSEVGWDGTPVYFADTSKSDGPIGAFGQTGMSFTDEVVALVNKPSDGMKRLSYFEKMVKNLKEVPDFLNIKHKTKIEEGYCEYVNGLSKSGPITVLLDEPDRSLSVENQILIWMGIPKILKDYQVIIATQSMIPLLKEIPDINLIDMEAGYFEHSKKMLNAYISGASVSELYKIAIETRKKL